MRTPRLLCALTVLALTGAPPAAAAPPASAQQFADAFERAKSQIRARGSEFRAARADVQQCVRVVEAGGWPDSARYRVGESFTGGLNFALFAPAEPVYGQLVDDLQAIRTRDPVLRSARAVWRLVDVQIESTVLSSASPCPALETWAKSGWDADKRPQVSTFLWLELPLLTRRTASDPRITRAVRRLRRLGVSKGDAERITGRTLLAEPAARLNDATTIGDDEDGT